MLNTDRAEFEAQLGALCAAYNVPMTEARIDGFWRGLSKMNLAQFARVIDEATSEGGPEKFPSVGQVWTLHRSLRAKASPVVKQLERDWGYDRWDASANFLLIRCALASGRSGMSKRDSGAGWKLARESAAQFRILALDGDPDASHGRLYQHMVARYLKLPEARP